MGELDKLYGRTRAEANPNRVMPTIDKFDVTARQGSTLELDFEGKKREKTDAQGGSLVVSDAERTKLDDLLRKRDNARRERNKALDEGNESAAKSNARKVRDASRDLGEQALDMWARQRAWEDGAKPSRSYKGQTSRSGDFDAVHTWKAKDGTQVYLVGEGKGGTADLGGKCSAANTCNKVVASTSSPPARRCREARIPMHGGQARIFSRSSTRAST